MSQYVVHEGDCVAVLATLEPGSVQTCITSPPYYGLRDYGTATWEGGDAECDHSPKAASRVTRPAAGLTGGKATVDAGTVQRDCHCGATRIDSQLGLEETPEQYVANLVAVFREVRRVLRDDGTLWLNLGDSYAGSWGAQSRDVVGAAGSASLAEGTPWTDSDSSASGSVSISATQIKAHPKQTRTGSIPAGATYKPKDLLGIPWMVAFALRADGWYLRSDIIWAKPNPMPESVTDRPTKAHEYLFLLSKSARYFYDADAVREGVSPDTHGGAWTEGGTKQTILGQQIGGRLGNSPDDGQRNKRSVWTVATQPFPGAHFATFPPKLIEPCVLAGSSPQACAECGAPWRRVTERAMTERTDGGMTRARVDGAEARHRRLGESSVFATNALPEIRTVGWEPTCDHPDGSGRCTVLDPFSGAGTTGVVTLRHDRDYIGIELNGGYAQMARYRIADDAPLLNVEAA